MRKQSECSLRARRSLLCGAGLFVAAQPLALQLLKRLEPNWRSMALGQTLTLLEQRRAQQPTARVVVGIGTSRMLFNFRGDVLEAELGRESPTTAVCFARAGAGPIMELVYLHRLLNAGIRPNMVLLEVLPPLLTTHVPLLELGKDRVPTTELSWDEVQMFERYAPGERPELRRQWCTQNLMSVYGLRLPLVDNIAPVLLTSDQRGIGKRNCFMDPWGAWHLERKDIPRHLNSATQIECYRGYFRPGFNVEGGPAQAVRDTVQLCQTHEIPVVIVLMPEGPAFRAIYSKEANTKIRRFLAQLRSEIDVPLIDATNWFPEESFCDSHHLYREDAADFSRRLASEIQQRRLLDGPRYRPSRPPLLANESSRTLS